MRFFLPDFLYLSGVNTYLRTCKDIEEEWKGVEREKTKVIGCVLGGGGGGSVKN